MTNPTSKSRLGRLLVGPAMVGALIGGFGVAAAQTGDPSTDSAPTTTVAEQPQAAAQEDAPSIPAPPAEPGAAAPEGEGRGPGPRHRELTGETAEKVKAAALAAVPGATVNRVVEGCGDSAYAAFLTKADGTRVVAKVNEAFAVTAVEDDLGPRGRHGGPGGPGGGGTPLTGEAADKATAAAQQAVPGGTVERVEANRDGDGYHAHVVKTDGTHVRVMMNAAFEVTSVEEAPARGPRPTPTPTA